jgi:hypothetical protein
MKEEIIMQRFKHRAMRLLPVFVLVAALILPTIAAPWSAASANTGARLAVSCGGGLPQQLNGESQIGLVASPSDQDSDGLTDATELNRTLTDPCNADTDGDGLLDSWEVDPAQVDPAVDKAGFDLDSDPDIEATRDAVFGPYAENGSSAQENDPDGRVPALRTFQPPAAICVKTSAARTSCSARSTSS